MKINHCTYIIKYLIVLVFCSVVACVAAPVQEMSDARQAIQAAKKVGAKDNNGLSRAESLLRDAEQALEEGEYKKARENATAARDKAMKVQRDSKMDLVLPSK